MRWPTHLAHRLTPPRCIAALSALLLPGSCALCGRCPAPTLCAHCRAHHLAHRMLRCASCAAEMSSLSLRCGRCRAMPPAFDASLAAACYAPPVDELVQRLKFGAQLPIAVAFADEMLQALQASDCDGVDALLPVPLSAVRLAVRGFNQALEIARPLARALQRPLIADACVRVRDTAPQSGLALADRQGNMRGAFAVREPSAVRGRHLLVIDDVMTTGHTLNALAACLKRHGAARVTNAVFARTPLR